VLSVDGASEVELADEGSEHTAQPEEVPQHRWNVEIQELGALLDERGLVGGIELAEVLKRVARCCGEDVDEVRRHEQNS